jgi:methylamine dehydrogenase accessory protein MauD
MHGLVIGSYIALWVVVVILSIVILSLAKQIALLHRRLAPMGARIENAGPAIGDRIKPFLGVDIYGSSVRIPSQDGRNVALVFVSSTCPACDSLAPALRSIAKHEKASMKVVLATFRGDDQVNREYAIKYGLDGLEFIFSPQLAASFNVLSTPYAVLVDGTGIVRTKGLVNNREHMESLLNAAEGNYESIQAFRFGHGSQDTLNAGDGSAADEQVVAEEASGD